VLVAPILIALMLGTATYGVYLACWIGVVQASAEAGRASVAGMSAAERQTLASARAQAVIAAYAPLLDQTKTVIEYPAATAGTFKVKVTYPVAELHLERIAAMVPVPAASPANTATVATGGY
jgi:Flp pilus assembly protein TadG